MPGDVVTVTFVRDNGQLRTTQVKLGEAMP
jgi:S1-C subfamily serine protease